MPIVKVLYFVDGRRKPPRVDSPTLAACSWPVPRLKGQEVNDTIGTEVVHQTLDGKANDSAVGDVDPPHDPSRTAGPQSLIGPVIDVVLRRPQRRGWGNVGALRCSGNGLGPGRGLGAAG